MAGYGVQRGLAVPARVGDVDLWIETAPVAGSELTSGRAGKVVDNATEAFEQGQAAIVAIASKLAGTIGELGRRRVYPDQVQVEFGLSFSATGNVIVAGSTVEATLKVSITYDRSNQAASGQPTEPTASATAPHDAG
jgi:hypothetical protein